MSHEALYEAACTCDGPLRNRSHEAAAFVIRARDESETKDGGPDRVRSSLRVRLICVHDLGRPDFIWADQRSWRLSAMLLQPHSKHPTRPPELALVNMIDCRTDIESVSRVPGSGGSFHCTGDVCICASRVSSHDARVSHRTRPHIRSPHAMVTLL